LRIGETDEEQATAKAKYRDLSTAAAEAPPSVEMTFVGWFGGRQTTATATTRATAKADPYGMTNKRTDNGKNKYRGSSLRSEWQLIRHKLDRLM
jgi:hypothetical protein